MHTLRSLSNIISFIPELPTVLIHLSHFPLFTYRNAMKQSRHFTNVALDIIYHHAPSMPQQSYSKANLHLNDYLYPGTSQMYPAS
jgi:predicted TIM-barrel fold metal-dependent hydrolase